MSFQPPQPRSQLGKLASTLPGKDKDEICEEAEKSMFFFAKGILGFRDLYLPVHYPLCELLEQTTIRKLKVMLPRSWFKSTVCTIAYPVWRVLPKKNRNLRFLIAQNTSKNALLKLGSLRGIFEKCDLFRVLFPDLLPTADCAWTAERLTIPRSEAWAEGTFEAVGTRTQVVSRHYDEIIEDDTVAPDKDELGVESLIPSKDDVDQAIGWHRLIPPLFVHPKYHRNIVVGTRWYELDLLSWIDSNEDGFRTYERAVREIDGHKSPEGQIVWPERFDAEVLRDLEHRMGPYLYSCLYMNTPLRSNDMTFQREWFQMYSDPPRDMVVYTTIDLASDPETSKGTSRDYNVVMTCGKDLSTGRIYVLDYWRARCGPSEVLHTLFDHYRKWKTHKVGVESIAYQSTFQYLIKERLHKERAYFVLEGLTHGGRSKASRIIGLQPLVHSGTLLFRPEQTLLISEMVSYPLGANDDLADALAMQIELWDQTRSPLAEDRRRTRPYDPMNLECLLDDLRDMAMRKGDEGPVFDTLSTGPREDTVAAYEAQRSQ